MGTSTEETIEKTVYKAFMAAVGRGDLAGAFEHTTEDVTFRPIGSHPDLSREFKGKEDILENCWVSAGRLSTEKVSRQ